MPAEFCHDPFTLPIPDKKQFLLSYSSKHNLLCPAHSYLGTNLLPGKDVQLCLCSATAGKSVSQETHYMLIDPGSGTHVASLLPSQGQLDSPCTSLPGINSRQFLKSCLPGAEDKFLLSFNLRISSLNLADNLLISRLLEELRWICRHTNVSSLLSALSAASISIQLQMYLGGLGTFPGSCLPPQLLQGVSNCYNFIYPLIVQVRDVFCRRVNCSPFLRSALTAL